MSIIVQDKRDKSGQLLRTNDIPRNTVFYGRLRSPRTGNFTPRLLWLHIGTYIDVQGPFTVSLEPRGDSTVEAAKSRYAHCIVTQCVEVIDYEPVDIRISVEG